MNTEKISFGVNLSVDDYGDCGKFASVAEDLGFDRVCTGAVSYTHLTLPTICSV